MKKKLESNEKYSTNKYEDFTNNTQLSIFLTVRDMFILNIIYLSISRHKNVKPSKNLEIIFFKTLH